MANLSSHGKHNIWLDNNIVYVESTGPWNMEYFQQLHLEMPKLIAQIPNQRYVVCLTLIGDAIPVKEAIAFHTEYVKTRSVLAIALDMSKCTSEVITQKILSDIYRCANIQHQFFEDSDTAKAWLIEVLQRKVD